MRGAGPRFPRIPVGILYDVPTVSSWGRGVSDRHVEKARIDKSSPIPYYEQLRAILGRSMAEGRLRVGAQLPSEAQLCDDYGVSRTVVRQALNELANEGLISRQKGKGSFVAPPKIDEHLAQSLTGLAEEVRERGQTLTNDILAFEKVSPAEHISQVLGLESGEPAVFLERLRSIDGEPWNVTSTYLPFDLCEPLLALDMRERSLYASLEELGLFLHHGRRTIEATVAGDEQAMLLGIPPRSPVLLLKSVAYLENGRPIEYFLAWHRGDRSRFDVHLRRHARPASTLVGIAVGSVGPEDISSLTGAGETAAPDGKPPPSPSTAVDEGSGARRGPGR
jgi:GntR family transcriptional regulator